MLKIFCNAVVGLVSGFELHYARYRSQGYGPCQRTHGTGSERDYIEQLPSSHQPKHLRVEFQFDPHTESVFLIGLLAELAFPAHVKDFCSR